MAKKNVSYKFSNATVALNSENRFILAEITKDDVLEYDFSKILEGLRNTSGLKISISSESDLESLVDDDDEKDYE